MLPSICSSLSIPLVAFLDGETGDSYFDSNSHPLLVLSSSSNASKDKTNPSAPATYHLFASKLVHDPKDKDAVKYLSSCALLKDNACWEGFSADLVQTNAIAAFAPYSKTFTTSASTKSFLFPPLFVVLNEAITPGASPTSRSVCVVRHSLNSQAAASMFLKSPWAIAWRQGILMIDYTLRSVIWVSLKTDSMGQQLDQWTFSRPITTLWAPSDNAEDQLVLQSARTLYAVSISSMKIETYGPSFDLRDDEVCHQILWSTRSQGTHSKSRPPYLAVSTSSRVLMLDESLHLLQSYEIPEEDSILSMSWMGMSLLFLSSSGVLRYMLPSSLNSTTAFSLKWNAIESHGIAISDSLDKELMSLPREMGSYSLKSLVSMLPDRAIFNYTETNSETSSSCNFITKPFIPLEPLVMGLLWQLIQSVPEDGKLIQADIAAALRAYVPSKSASNIVAGTPSMQCSLLLVSSLYCAGLVELAAFAAGMDLSSSQPDRSFTADGELPSKRWLPPALRYEILKSLGLFKQAVGQLLSPYPDALELFLDSEAMTTAALPRLSSAASLACSAAACDLFRLEKHQLALRLADIAGNDSLLATMLQKLGRQSELDSFLEIVRSFSYIHYLRICKVLTISPEKCSSEPLIASAASVGVEIRRPSLLSKNFSFHSSAESDPLLNDNERPIPQAAKLWDGLGAVSRFGVLAMDSVEEWIGTQVDSIPTIIGYHSVIKICTDARDLFFKGGRCKWQCEHQCCGRGHRCKFEAQGR